MSQAAKRPISPSDLLAADENQIIVFLTECYTHGRYDISNITGLDTISPQERDAIGTKLINASKKMNPLAPDKLTELLQGLNCKLPQIPDSPASCTRACNERCPTLSPPPAEDAIQRQASDRSKLALAGGRPIMPMRRLGTASTMTRKSLARAALWVDLPKKHQAASYKVLPLFSKQLEHWTTFQQYWQWGNRGKSGRDKGFALFLASKRQHYLDIDAPEAIADPDSFERMAWRMWQYEQPKHTASATNSETFASYVHAAKSRLALHSFKRPFRPFPDPRKQDNWTTWVEYLNYIYWEVERDAAAMTNAEPRYRRAMEELLLPVREEAVQDNKGTTLQEQLKAAKEALRKQCVRFNKIRQEAENYLTYEACLRRGYARAEWVLEELALIEKGGVKDESGVTDSRENAEEASVKGSITMANEDINARMGSGRLLRKRKTRHDRDEEQDKCADNTAEDEEPPASSSKRSRRQGGTGSFVTLAPVASLAADSVSRSRLCRSRRSRRLPVSTT